MKKNDENIRNLFSARLHPGETLSHWAYGVKQPSIPMIFLIYFFGFVLVGAIVVMLLTKQYALGLTSKGRLIVLRIDNKLTILEQFEYKASDVHSLSKVSTNPIFVHIAISDPLKPFAAKFHRLGLPENRVHSMAIAEAVSGKMLPH